MNTSIFCDHHTVLPAYRTTLAEAWGIDYSAPERLEEFQQLVHEINAAIAAKYPDISKLTDSSKGNKPEAMRVPALAPCASWLL